MKSKNVEQNTGRKKRRKIPYISDYIHKGATSLSQVCISPKVLLSNLIYLPVLFAGPM